MLAAERHAVARRVVRAAGAQPADVVRLEQPRAGHRAALAVDDGLAASAGEEQHGAAEADDLRARPAAGRAGRAGVGTVRSQ